jgi:homoserine O-acetyltransferase (EC 2.3.1.31)
MIHAQKRSMDFLGVQKIKMVIGGSLGGMQLLNGR